MKITEPENWNMTNVGGGGLDYSGFLDRFLREPSRKDIDRDLGFVHRRSKQKNHKARCG